MFSDVIVEHGGGSADADHALNVGWAEKSSQDRPEAAAEHPSGSGRSSPSSLNRKPSLKHRPASRTADERLPGYSAPGPGPGSAPVNGAGLTCQELLALSGALGAALPTPLALPSYPAASGGTEEVSAVGAGAALVAKHGNNNHQLAPPGQLMPVLPTLAMSLWPEPFPGRQIQNPTWRAISAVQSGGWQENVFLFQTSIGRQLPADRVATRVLIRKWSLLGIYVDNFKRIHWSNFLIRLGDCHLARFEIFLPFSI